MQIPRQSDPRWKPAVQHQKLFSYATRPTSGQRPCSTLHRSIGATLGITSMILLLSATACQAAAASSSFDSFSATFAPCPDSPNCVSTQADPTDDIHYMSALPYSGTVLETKEKLLAIIKAQPRTTVVEERDTYLHVEFRSLIMRFVDDVEFSIDDAAGLVQFRSASRVGYSDLGVNRKRMETIGALFVQ